MQTKEFDFGRLTITEDGTVTASCGMPSIENVLGFDGGIFRGTMKVEQNADIEFVPDKPRHVVPPSLADVIKDGNVMVKRTTRNFIVTMKFPIIESATVTAQSHKEMWTKCKKAIASVREQIKQEF